MQGKESFWSRWRSDSNRKTRSSLLTSFPCDSSDEVRKWQKLIGEEWKIIHCSLESGNRVFLTFLLRRRSDREQQETGSWISHSWVRCEKDFDRSMSRSTTFDGDRRFWLTNNERSARMNKRMNHWPDRREDERFKWPAAESAGRAQGNFPDDQEVSSDVRCIVFVCGHSERLISTRTLKMTYLRLELLPERIYSLDERALATLCGNVWPHIRHHSTQLTVDGHRRVLLSRCLAREETCSSFSSRE